MFALGGVFCALFADFFSFFDFLYFVFLRFSSSGSPPVLWSLRPSPAAALLLTSCRSSTARLAPTRVWSALSSGRSTWTSRISIVSCWTAQRMCWWSFMLRGVATARNSHPTMRRRRRRWQGRKQWSSQRSTQTSTVASVSDSESPDSLLLSSSPRSVVFFFPFFFSLLCTSPPSSSPPLIFHFFFFFPCFLCASLPPLFLLSPLLFSPA